MINSIPSFSLIGRANAGKSSILATLLEYDSNEAISVSPMAGETLRNHELFLNISSRGSQIRFFDTPGFQDAIAAKQKIINIQQKEKVSVQEAIASFRETNETEFKDERRLLASLEAGTLPIYIVNPEFSFQESFAAEIDILEMAGFDRQRRIALINLRGDGEISQTWRQYLEQSFAHVIEFNAHNARFTERKYLLTKLGEVSPLFQDAISQTVLLLDEAWQERRKHSAQQIMNVFQSVLRHEETGYFTRKNEEEKKALEKKLTKNFQAHINKCIGLSKQEMLKTYRYEELAFEDSCSIEEDIEWDNHQTWERLGLSRQRLTVAASAASAATGAGIDVALGGISLGIAAVGGALIGGGLTFLAGDRIPTFSMKIKNIRKTIKSVNGPQNNLILSFPIKENLPWVILDHLLISFAQILANPHGKRSPFEGSSFDSFCKDKDKDKDFNKQLKNISRFFAATQQGNDKHDKKALESLMSILKDIEEIKS